MTDLAPTPPYPERVTAVLVNYKTPELAIECLRALSDVRSACPNLTACVVDNASPDHSLKKIQSAAKNTAWQEWISVLGLPENKGYGFGNNAGVRHALAQNPAVDYFWFLNPDTVPAPDALTPLIGAMRLFPDAGICGSRLENPRGISQRTARRFHSPPGELWETGYVPFLLGKILAPYLVCPPCPDSTQTCDWVSGASFFVRRQTFEALGGFDPGYFLYFEDEDFCRRALQKGWETLYVPASRVLHLQNPAKDHLKFCRWPKCWYASRQKFFLSAYGPQGLMAADFFRILGFLGVWCQRLGALSRKIGSALWNLMRHDLALLMPRRRGKDGLL